jgi:hypothetical protein
MLQINLKNKVSVTFVAKINSYFGVCYKCDKMLQIKTVVVTRFFRFNYLIIN